LSRRSFVSLCEDGSPALSDDDGSHFPPGRKPRPYGFRLVEHSAYSSERPEAAFKSFRIPHSDFRIPIIPTSAFRIQIIPHSAFRIPIMPPSEYNLFRNPNSKIPNR
jgi:hypothetical protein